MEEMAELIKENEELKKKIKTLESIINRGSSGNTGAYNAIRAMIIEKVQNEVEQPEELKDWMNKDTRNKAERQIMRDLKWDLRVRNVSDFRAEHVEPAREYIKNYILPDDLKISRWKGAV